MKSHPLIIERILEAIGRSKTICVAGHVRPVAEALDHAHGHLQVRGVVLHHQHARALAGSPGRRLQLIRG